MAKLDSLIVDLQLNTAELRKGLDEANAKLGDFGKKIDNLAGVITFDKVGKMAFNAAKSLVEFALGGAKAADEMGKMAQSAGTSVENFSRMNYAAGLSDVSTEQLGTAMLKLNKNITDAATGQRDQVALFGALGVAVTGANGKIRSADAVMGDLADVFSRMKDGAAKASLATEVFGKSGAQLIPFLNQGRDGLAEMAAEADRLGITISTSAAAAAEEFNDNLTRMQVIAQSVAQRAAAELTPALANLSDQLLNTKEGANVLKGAAETLAAALKILVSAGVIVGAVFEVLGKEIARTASLLWNTINGRFSAALEDAKGYFTDIVDASKTAGQRLTAIWSTAADQSSTEIKKTATAAQLSADKMAAAFERAKKAADEHKEGMKSLTKVAEDLESKVASFGFGELGLIEARLNAGDLSEELKKVGASADEMKQRILDAAQALNDLKIDLKMDEIKFQIGRTETATQQNINERRRDYAIATTADPNARRTLEMAGFKDFDDALSALSDQTRKNAEALGQAELLKIQNDLEGARAATLVADETANAAAKAGQAADAFVDLAKESFKRQKEIVNTALGVLSKIGERGAEVTQLVNSAMEGFKAGGIWGAIIAVIVNLLAKLEAVGTFIDTAFSSFMEGFGQLNDSMSVLFGSLTESLEPVMRALKIAFKVINDVLAPIFSVMQQVMEHFEAIADGFLDLIEATGILEFVVKAVAFVFNTIGVIVGVIILGMQYLWAGILRAVRAVIAVFTVGAGTREIDKTIAEHDQAIADTKARIEKTSSNLDKTDANRTDTGDGASASGKAPTANGVGTGTPEFEAVWARNEERARQAEAKRYTAYSDAIAAGLGYEAAEAAGEAAKKAFLALPLDAIVIPGVDGLGEAANDAAAELNKFSSSLTNVPQGFKYKLSAFNSMTGEDAGGRFDTREIYNINVEGSLLTESGLQALITTMNERKRFRNSGTPIGP